MLPSSLQAPCRSGAGCALLQTARVPYDRVLSCVGRRAGEREPEVELAACAHMLSPDVPASALAALFEEHRVSAADVADRGDAALQPEKLVVRLNSVVYRCATPPSTPVQWPL